MWRDHNSFPEARFDWLAVVLSRVELDDIWPEGLLDAYVTMILEADGDATLLERLSGFVIWMVGFGLGSLLGSWEWMCMPWLEGRLWTTRYPWKVLVSRRTALHPSSPGFVVGLVITCLGSGRVQHASRSVAG